MKPCIEQCIGPQRQRGVTLVVALIVLVLIMMIGIVAISTSDTQFKLAGNIQFEDSAMNNAEAGIAAGERWLSTGTNYLDPGFLAFNAATPEILPIGYLAAQTAPANSPLTMTWGDGNSRCVGDTVMATAACDTEPAPGGNPAQRYYIEMLSLNNRLQGSSQVVGGRTSTGCNQVNTYQVTARGTSARGATKIVQSYYSHLNCPA